MIASLLRSCAVRFHSATHIYLERNDYYLSWLPDIVVGVKFLSEVVELNDLVHITTHSFKFLIKSFHFYNYKLIGIGVLGFWGFGVL